jgi:methionine-rich copper-binding protein CopC
MTMQRILTSASRFAATVLLLLGLCFAPTGAWAHAYLQKAVPAQRAVLFDPPTRVELWFNERLEAAFCTMTVKDASGASVDTADVKVAADDPKQLTVGLKALTPGVYTVQFRVLSVDGHVVTDKFTFTLRERR